MPSTPGRVVSCGIPCTAGTVWLFVFRLCLIHHPQTRPPPPPLLTHIRCQQPDTETLSDGGSVCFKLPMNFSSTCPAHFLLTAGSQTTYYFMFFFFLLLNSAPGQPFSPLYMYVFGLHWVEFLSLFRGAGTVARTLLTLKPRCIWTWDFQNSKRFVDISQRRKGETFHDMCAHM